MARKNVKRQKCFCKWYKINDINNINGMNKRIVLIITKKE